MKDGQPMSTGLFDSMHTGIYLGIVVLILLFYEIGYQIGVCIKIRPDKEVSSTPGQMPHWRSMPSMQSLISTKSG